jgi:hypothetical protein
MEIQTSGPLGIPYRDIALGQQRNLFIDRDGQLAEDKNNSALIGLDVFEQQQKDLSEAMGIERQARQLFEAVRKIDNTSLDHDKFGTFGRVSIDNTGRSPEEILRSINDAISGVNGLALSKSSFPPSVSILVNNIRTSPLTAADKIWLSHIERAELIADPNGGRLDVTLKDGKRITMDKRIDGEAVSIFSPGTGNGGTNEVHTVSITPADGNNAGNNKLSFDTYEGRFDSSSIAGPKFQF